MGVTLLDRLAVIMGHARVELRCENEELIADYLRRGQGVILVGAHVGSWELGGHLLSERLDCPVNIVVLEREEEKVRRLFAAALENRRFRLLTTDGHPLRSIPILAALRRGEIVALHGDRPFGGASRSLPFLGGMVSFPTGPYLLAAASGAPLFQVFALREQLGLYRFFTFPPTLVSRDKLRASSENLDPFIRDYAGRLERVAREYPFQWGNIYPFWEEPAARHGSKEPRGEQT